MSQDVFNSLSPRGLRPVLMTAMLLLGVCASHRGEELVAVNAPVDTDHVKPPSCRKCRSRGSVDCTGCKGSGISFTADIECTRCKGKGWYPCTKCGKTGKVKCSKCRRRKIKGESTRAMISPEWKEWNSKRDSFAIDTDRPQEGEPRKYVKCTYCNATGERPCASCEGTTKGKCVRCKGKGTNKGRGPCPLCEGSKRGACAACAQPDGGKVEGLKALEGLRREKFLTETEYYSRRRLLVAKQKYIQAVREERRAKLEAQKEKEAAAARAREAAQEAEGTPAKEEQPGEKAPKKEVAVNWDEMLRTHRVLLSGFCSGIITPEVYDEKVRGIGLPADKVREMEERIAKRDPKLKKFSDLRRAFEQGRVDLAEYRKQRAEL